MEAPSWLLSCVLLLCLVCASSSAPLSKCSLNDGVALLYRDFRINETVAVVIASPQVGVSIDKCAELCCANGMLTSFREIS